MTVAAPALGPLPGVARKTTAVGARGASPDGKAAPGFAGGSDVAIGKDSERQDLAWASLTVLL
ncbi:hypothetical protein, partial [Micromonospora sp. NPDC023633]|uniref:hypothetical protein n=1 Tax=Micromonospora sp. NPDC023633 TaxID=3154320 RepID=UPI0033F77F8D